MKKQKVLILTIVAGVILMGLTPGFTWSLREAAEPYRGERITALVTSEPPNFALQNILPLFEKETGIKVDIETAPFMEVHAKLSMVLANQLGTYDMAYIDKAYMGMFHEHLMPIREFEKAHPELVDPDFDFDDFFPILITKQASWGGTVYGYPFDVPVILMVYRKDLFEKYGITVPQTYEEFRDTASFLTDELAPEMYGCMLIAKENYAVVTDWAGFLWAFGGRFFDGEGNCVLNSPEAIESLEFYKSLLPVAVPGASNFDWGSRIDAIAAGKVAMALVHQEGFPLADNPATSAVAGKLGLALPPRGPRPLIRDPEKLSYGEWPGLARSGGSNYTICKYTDNPEATFLFMQWATSREVQKIASVIMGGATPTRISIYSNPDVIARMKPGIAGTTRHFSVSKKIIEDVIGFEPVPPQYPRLMEVYYRHLSRAVTGKMTNKEALDAMVRETEEIVAE